MNGTTRSGLRLLFVTVVLAALMVMGTLTATAQENGELYPLPEETPVTGVLGDVEVQPDTGAVADPETGAVADAEAPITAVLPSDLARTGFGLSAPLALGSLLVLLGASIVIADRRYRRRQERSIAA